MTNYYYPQYSQNNQQIQNGGFIPIQSEEMVYSYPVAPGNCVRFKVEGKPIYFEKTVGYSQFEDPKIERYRLVKEEAPREPEQEVPSELDSIKADLEKIWGEINALKPKKTTKRSADGED